MSQDATLNSRDRESLTLSIEGMHCGACVRRVTTALSSVAGVKVENVEVGSASVAYDPAATSPAEIAAAVNRIGFTAAQRQN